MTNGKIILLNGASSSGKTSIARALQEMLEPIWLYSSLDHFLEMLSSRAFGVDTPDSDPSAEWFRWLSYEDERGTAYRIQPGALAQQHITGVMHPAIRALAAGGRNVIIDDVLLVRTWLESYLQVLDGFEVWFAKVDCPLAVLEARERARGDRTIGQARGQQRTIHQGLIYDLEVDSSLLTPAESAAKIRELMEHAPSAFVEMRRRFPGSATS